MFNFFKKAESRKFYIIAVDGEHRCAVWTEKEYKANIKPMYLTLKAFDMPKNANPYHCHYIGKSVNGNSFMAYGISELMRQIKEGLTIETMEIYKA